MDKEKPNKQPVFQRRWLRFPVDLRLRVRVNTPTGTEYILAHGRDVSQGGMAVYVAVELDIGDIAELEILFPGASEAVRLRATVRYRDGFKYGVEFLDPTPDQQDFILANLRRLVRTG